MLPSHRASPPTSSPSAAGSSSLPGQGSSAEAAKLPKPEPTASTPEASLRGGGQGLPTDPGVLRSREGSVEHQAGLTEDEADDRIRRRGDRSRRSFLDRDDRAVHARFPAFTRTELLKGFVGHEHDDL